MVKGGIQLTGKVTPILNGVSWQKKAFAVRRYVRPSDTKASLSARIALAEKAGSCFGKTGKVGGLPVVAAEVQGSLSGKSYGGMSKKERSELAHRKAAGSIAAMKTKLARL